MEKKSSANVILEATYTDVVGNSYKVPLYANWNYGNGKVSSFSSTISGKWISNWKTDTSGKKVLSNIDESNKPTERINSAFMFDTVNKGTQTELIVTAPSVNVNSILNVKVTLPSGEEVEKQLNFNSENYSTLITTDVVGEYL